MKTYIFRVKLADQKRIYRDIELPEKVMLYKLAEAINDAYGFMFDHPFGFYSKIKDRYYYDSEEQYELFTDISDIESTDAKSVEKTKINQVWTEIGKEMLFLFDYGDEWRWLVTLRGFGEKRAGVKYPVVINSVGDAPEQYPDYDEDELDEEGAVVAEEYIQCHDKLPEHAKGYKQEDIDNAKKTLKAKRRPLKDYKLASLLLAHVGTADALKSLEQYADVAPPEMLEWITTAIGECQIFIDEPADPKDL